MVPRAGNWCVWRNGGRSAGWQLRCSVRAFDFDKRVLRLMRQDNLLAVRKRRFVFTTASASPTALSIHCGLSAANDLSTNGNLSLISESQHKGAVQAVTTHVTDSPLW